MLRQMDSWTVNVTTEADAPLLVVDGKSFGQIQAACKNSRPSATLSSY